MSEINFPMISIEICEADLSNPAHQAAVVKLLDSYSLDPMGSGKPLLPETRSNLIAGLQQHPTTIVFLAFKDREAVGVAVCFRGFSTFAAKPLINIHDLAVLPEHRGQGIGKRLLATVEHKARALGCCKLTLEVLENNRRAKHAYQKAGFAHAMHDEAAGHFLFFSKPL